MKILVIRNDKLGDFMLTFPSFALLKASLPQARVHALVNGYTRPMADLCPGIDTVICDPLQGRSLRSWRTLVERLRRERYDAVITLFSTTRVATAGAIAGVPYRLAPATKLAQLFYNQRLTQRRSRSEKPEWQYNVDLVARFLEDHDITPAPLPTAPYLQFPAGETAELRRALRERYAIAGDAPTVFIHPGSGGSANNLTTARYAALAGAIFAHRRVHFLIGCGPGERSKGEALAAGLGDMPHSVLHGNELADYARHIACADLFISGSTGPLHIAGALDVSTAAFYPRRRSATALRWQTLNAPEHRLAFSPPEGADESDMAAIDLQAAAAAIAARFLRG